MKKVLKSNLVASILIVVVVSLVTAFAGDVVVKEGAMEVEALKSNGDLEVVTGTIAVTGPNGTSTNLDAPDVLIAIAGDGKDSTYPAGDGGGFVLTAGDGGWSEQDESGVGGGFVLTAGAGGDGDGADGGKGGCFVLTAGAGGDSDQDDGGNGGDIELITGAGGTGTSNGVYGNITLAKNGGNIGIGTTTFNSSANGVLAIKNGTEPSSGTANQAYLYAKDDAGKSHIYTMDEDGNATKLGAHNDKGEWEFYSVNVRSGRVVRVNMEKLVKAVEKLTGEKFMMESYVE